MTLRQLTRLVKISTIVAGTLSILLTSVWVTVRVVLIQHRSNEHNNSSGCLNSSLLSLPLKSVTTVIIPLLTNSSTSHYTNEPLPTWTTTTTTTPSSSSSSTTLRVVTTIPTTTLSVTTSKPCFPVPEDEKENVYDVYATFFLTCNIIWAIVNVAAQIFLYFAANRRSIRKTQTFVIFMVTSTVIYTILSFYLLVMFKFEDFTMTTYNAVTGGVQLYFVLKFLNCVIASSPRASLVDPSSSTINDDGSSGGQ